MACNSNTKGKTGEREVAKLLRDYGFEARRGVQYSGGADSPDVVSDFPLHIEVKRVEKLNIDAAVRQAENDAGNTLFSVFHRKNKQDWLVTMKAETLLELLRGDKLGL